MENLFYIGQQINNTVGYVHCCSNIMLSSNGQYCYFFKIIALYIYSIIHVHVVNNNEIHEEWIQIQLMIRSLEWVVILFSPFRCFIIPFLCSQHAIKFFDFSFSLCISVTNIDVLSTYNVYSNVENAFMQNLEGLCCDVTVNLFTIIFTKKLLRK